MQGLYQEYSPANKLNDLCQDLITRRRFYDIRTYSILIVDELFNNASIDLCFIPFKAVDLQRFEHLIGVKSEVFKYICGDDRLFNHFLYSFGSYCRKGRIPFDILYNSLYLWYFESVLVFLLPDNDTSLATLKKTDWFCAINKLSATKSALRLLKPQVIAASYSPDLFARTDGFHSLYPRVYDFSKFMFSNLADRTTIPSEAQVAALKFLVEHYTYFLVVQTCDADFNAFKDSLRNMNFVSAHVKPFLHRWLQTMAVDQIYIKLVELWIGLIDPGEAIKNREHQELFYHMFSSEFKDLFFIILDRCQITDLSLLSHITFLSFVVDYVFSPAMSIFYQKFGIVVEDCLTMLQTKVNNYLQAVEADHREKQKYTAQNKIAAFFGLFHPVSQPQNMKELKALLNNITGKLGGKEPSNSASGLQLSNISGSDSTLSTSFHPLANSTPVRNTPDYSTDPITKLRRLTPHGRNQVIRRQACFDFSPCAATMARISPHAGPMENEFMVKLMLHLSEKYSDSQFTHYLRINNGRTTLATILSKIFLSNPYANRHVPVYSRNPVKTLPKLNLRFMATYPFIITALLFLWFLVSFILGIFF